MKLANKTKWVWGLLIAAGLFLLSTSPVSAQRIAYHPLRYGTNQTSMADGYFVKPANVVVKNHLYYVTMQIKTAKSLSSFPVKVMWVNGRAPVNVRRVKDRAGNSHVYYSFYTNNLRKRINAKLAIDVPKVYKAHHLISFKFSTTGLPSLGTRHRTVVKAQTASASSAKVAQQKKKQQQPKKSSQVSHQTTTKHPKKSSKVKKQTKNTQKPKKTPAKKASSQPSKSGNLTKPAKRNANKPHAKKSGVPWIVGGVTLIAGISAGLWIYFRH